MFPHEPDFKKLKRRDSVEPLEESSSSTLPKLPEDLKKRQEEIEISAGHSVRIPTPPKTPSASTKTNSILRGVRFSTTASPKSHTYDAELENLIDSGISDPSEILKLVRMHPNIGFLYMTTGFPRSSINYNPYNVK